MFLFYTSVLSNFENNVTKGDLLIHLPPYFQLHSIILLAFTDIFLISALYVFKVVCCRFVVCGKGLFPSIFKKLFDYEFLAVLFQNQITF